MSDLAIECRPAEASVNREAESLDLVKRSVAYAVGGALIPIPVVDIVGVAGAQTQLLMQLSRLYGTSYSEHVAKNVIATLIGSLGTGVLATGLVASAVKIIPVFGTLSGMVSLPIVAGALTYALGKVFIQHFETGGTLLNFDPNKTKQYFAEQFAEGKLVATKVKEPAPVHAATTTFSESETTAKDALSSTPVEKAATTEVQDSQSSGAGASASLEAKSKSNRPASTGRVRKSRSKPKADE